MCKCCCWKKEEKKKYVCKNCGKESDRQEVCCGEKMIEKK